MTAQIPLGETAVPRDRFLIKEGSEAEKAFLDDIGVGLGSIPRMKPDSEEATEALAKVVASTLDRAWVKHATKVGKSKGTKPWWDDKCTQAFEAYTRTRDKSEWREFRKTVRETKRQFFDRRIDEIANSNKRPWDLMEWVKQRKLPPAESMQGINGPCLSLEDLWNSLHDTYNAANNREVDLSVLDQLPDK